jgi:transposase
MRIPRAHAHADQDAYDADDTHPEGGRLSTADVTKRIHPPRPCFAPFPSNVKKRKMNAMAQKNTTVRPSSAASRWQTSSSCLFFETERMSRRATRIFGNKTARQLYTWSHYSFSQRLYYKSQTTANKQVAFTREPGASKTCDCCGSWNAKLIGGNGTEDFTCRACGYAADRDHHGARGNLLSALGAALNVGPNDVER